MTYTLDGETIKSINLIADDNIRKTGLLNMTLNIYENWFNMLR